MKNRNLLLVSGAVIMLIASAGIYVETGKSGKTGSPSEGTCADCHTNSALNAGGGSVMITCPNMTNWVYTPGTTYHMSVMVSDAGKTLFGLGVEALRLSDNGNAGTLVITNSTETHLVKASNGRMNVVQQLDGGLVTVAGSKTFTFDWTAPASDSGAVMFYVSGVGAIGDSDPSDDNPYWVIQRVNSPISQSVDDISASSVNFIVYPNPATDVLNFTINISRPGQVRGGLYSIVGQKVADLFSEKVSAGTIEKHIPISGLMAGTYFVKIDQAGASSIQKIMIQ